MTATVPSHDRFPHLIGRSVRLEPTEGAVFTAMLKKTTTFPRSMMPGSPRLPFNLILEMPAQEAGDFIGGDFTITIEGDEPFGPFYLHRIMSIKPDTALLEIIFN